jgi:hypothetical protein
VEKERGEARSGRGSSELSLKPGLLQGLDDEQVLEKKLAESVMTGEMTSTGGLRRASRPLV